ncbi:MAG: flavin reductase family protein [Synechococcus sp.]
MPDTSSTSFVELDTSQPIWERFFSVAPLIVVGTREPDGNYDLAPKHMAMPLGWENYFGFICTPRHRTYTNTRREGYFTVSFPNPEQVVLASLSAAPRDQQGDKPSLTALPTVPATAIDGVFLQDSRLCLECQLETVVDGFGDNSLIAGKIVAARVQAESLRSRDRDDTELIASQPLLAYLPPNRFTRIDRSFSFPFHVGFHR